MSRQLSLSLAAEFPEFIEVNSVLRLAALTWTKFGISAADLIELDPWIVEMIRISLES